MRILVTGSYCPSCLRMFSTEAQTLKQWKEMMAGMTCSSCGDGLMPMEREIRETGADK